MRLLIPQTQTKAAELRFHLCEVRDGRDHPLPANQTLSSVDRARSGTSSAVSPGAALQQQQLLLLWVANSKRTVCSAADYSF